MSRPYQSKMTQIFDPLSELELSFISCILFEATPEETDVANTMLMLLQLHCRALEAMETSETSNGESNGLWLRLWLSQRPRDNEKTQVVFHLHRRLFDLFCTEASWTHRLSLHIVSTELGTAKLGGNVEYKEKAANG